MKALWSAVVLSLLFIPCLSARPEGPDQPSPDEHSLDELSSSFWQWRAVEQPFTGDDIPRIDRPAALTVDWSPKTIQQRLHELGEFEQRWKALAPAAQAPVHDQVDYRLLASALARVRWELAIQKNWQRDPDFYVDQTLGSVYVLLLPPPPFSAERQQEILARLKQIPATIDSARQNLTDIRQPFARLAIDSLDRISERLLQVQSALAPEFSEANRPQLAQAISAASSALTGYRAWVETKLSQARTDTAIGPRELYLVPPQRGPPAVFTGAAPRNVSPRVEPFRRLRGLPGAAARRTSPAAIFPNADAQIAAEKSDEAQVRAFLGSQKILTVPSWMKHYRNLLLPAYLEPLEGLGVTDDLTGPSRLNEDGTSYIRRPSPDLGYFQLSTARDPRPILVHEGVPGHYFQLCLGWHNDDPIRRHYYDSNANEGIGFYAEEMMLQAGFFEDNPHTRATIYNFMRLRALRVEVDVKLALGEFTLEQAANYLAATVPMDRRTALGEAAMFSSTPGQAISYQIGKLQIIELLSDARLKQGPAFSMLNLNDFVWNNGNVPLSLQRWELLGDASQVPAVTPVPAQ